MKGKQQRQAQGVFHCSSPTSCCFNLRFKWDVREQRGVCLRRVFAMKESKNRLPKASSSSSASWSQADVTHCPHCERNSVCFLRESSPLGLQGFPGRQVGFPQICVCVFTHWGYFSSTQASGSMWSGWGSAARLRRHLYGSSVWPLEQVSHTHTSFQLPLHVRTHSNAHVNTLIDICTHTNLPPDRRPNTQVHTCSPTTNHISHYSASNLVWIPPEGRKKIWSGQRLARRPLRWMVSMSLAGRRDSPCNITKQTPNFC